MLRAREQLRAAAEECTGSPPGELFFEFTGLVTWHGGSRIGWHHDANRPYLAARAFSLVCYLNGPGDDYSGGLFSFRAAPPGRPEEEVIRPSPGRLLVYSTGPENTHRVSPVRPGRLSASPSARRSPLLTGRHTLAVWLTRDAREDADAGLLRSWLGPLRDYLRVRVRPGAEVEAGSASCQPEPASASGPEPPESHRSLSLLPLTPQGQGSQPWVSLRILATAGRGDGADGAEAGPSTAGPPPPVPAFLHDEAYAIPPWPLRDASTGGAAERSPEGDDDDAGDAGEEGGGLCCRWAAGEDLRHLRARALASVLSPESLDAEPSGPGWAAAAETSLLAAALERCLGSAVLTSAASASGPPDCSHGRSPPLGALGPAGVEEEERVGSGLGPSGAALLTVAAWLQWQRQLGQGRQLELERDRDRGPGGGPRGGVTGQGGEESPGARSDSKPGPKRGRWSSNPMSSGEAAPSSGSFARYYTAHWERLARSLDLWEATGSVYITD